MFPIVCCTVPSVPHFGHLLVGWVGAGTWTGMGSTLARSRGRRRPGRVRAAGGAVSRAASVQVVKVASAAVSRSPSSHLAPELSAHLLAATPTCHYLEWVDWANAILEEPLRIEDGFARVPDRPGTGLAWRREAVEALALAR
jgi:hypothetical protein